MIMARSLSIVLVWIVLQETNSQMASPAKLSGPRPFNTKQQINQSIQPIKLGNGNLRVQDSSDLPTAPQIALAKSSEDVTPSSESSLIIHANHSLGQKLQFSPTQVHTDETSQDTGHNVNSMPKTGIKSLNDSQDFTKEVFISNQTLDHMALPLTSASSHFSKEIFPLKSPNNTEQKQNQKPNLTVVDRPESSTEIPHSPSKRPLGTLYVGSVHRSVYPSRSLQVGSVTPCLTEDLEDKVLHQLSTSKFGYPKSIVDTAMDGSDAKRMLRKMATFLRLMNEANGNELPSAKNDNNNNIGTTFLKAAFNEQVRGQYPHHHEGSPKLFARLFQDSVANNKGKFGHDGSNAFRKLSSMLTRDYSHDPRPTNSLKPTPNSEYPIEAKKDTRFKSPFLLDDSAFGSQHQESQLTTEKPTTEKSIFDDALSEVQTDGTQNPDNNSDKSYFSFPASKQTKDQEKFGESFQDMFGESFQDITIKDGSWLSSSVYPETFTSFEKLTPKAFNSDINSLFPPKPEHFMDTTSSKDFIKYAPDKNSNVASPFQLNSKSLLNTISKGRFGEGISGKLGGISGLGSKSSFLSSLETQPAQNDKEATMGNFFQRDHFQIPGYIRTKRQARETANNRKRDSSTEASCPTVHKILRQYKNHGGTCFVVEPEIQSVHFTSCSNKRCRGCHVDGGDSRCQAVHVPVWVWSYCEEGPHAGKVMPDHIHVSVACTCQIFHCQLDERK